MDMIIPENEVRLCVGLADMSEAATLVLRKEPEIMEGSVDADARIHMDRSLNLTVRITHIMAVHQLRAETDIEYIWIA